MIHSHGVKESSALHGGTALSLTFRTVEQYLAVPKNVRLLDVGCGTGQFLKMPPPSFSGVGVDRNGLTPISVNISYEPLPFPDGSFDIVTAWQVFEHLENPFFAGREIRRVLRPEGICIISVPNIMHIRSRLHFLLNGGILRWNKHNDHIFVPLKAILQKAVFQGFSLLERIYADGAIIRQHSSLFAKNAYYVFQKI